MPHSQIDLIIPLFGYGEDMLKHKKIMKNKAFTGRQYEQNYLRSVDQSKEPAIIAVYGRRRVGKTELIEQTYANRNIIKFEGLESEPESAQITHTLNTLAKYANEPNIAKLQLKSWVDVFELIAQHLKKGIWTLYLEELQWMANYQTSLISALKYVWDNEFRHNKQLIIVLCGSSPSFMINKVVRSKALYNRSQYELPLHPFNIQETQDFIQNKSSREVMDTYLSVGGIPEYLGRIKKQASSLFLGLCQNAFTTGGFLQHEHKKIFTSSLAKSKYYEDIIRLLSCKRFATREEIRKSLKIDSGGTLSNVLKDLELCGFIKNYVPYNLGKTSTLSRYAINDQYLQFYFKFIAPKHDDIVSGIFNKEPSQAINFDTYMKWLGFAFERFCRENHRLIATILGFSGVTYQHGAYFSRSTEKEKPGFQIDLLFHRQDRVITLCEIKYLKQPVKRRIIKEFEEKKLLFPCPKNHSIQSVLISAEGADKSVSDHAYFDKIITLEDLFAASKFLS